MVTALRTGSCCPDLPGRQGWPGGKLGGRPQQASALARKIPGCAPLVAMASAGSALAGLLPGAVAYEQGQDFADGGFLAGGFLAGGFWQREVCLDLVEVAAA